VRKEKEKGKDTLPLPSSSDSETQAPTESQLEALEETQLPLSMLEDGDYPEDDEGSVTYEDGSEEASEVSENPEISEEKRASSQEYEGSEKAASPSPSSSSQDAERQESDKRLTSDQNSSEEPSPLPSPELHRDQSIEMATAQVERPLAHVGENEEGPAQKARKVRNGARMTNSRRSKLRANQNVSIDRIKNALDYGDVHMSDGVREAISHSMNFFASNVLLRAKALIDMEGKERLMEKHIAGALDSVVPYSPLSTRIANNVENAHVAWTARVPGGTPSAGEDAGKKNIRVEKVCGLNVSISSLQNLAKQVAPTMRGVSNKSAFVILGAAVEVVAEAIIQRAVGAMISGSVRTVGDHGEDGENGHGFKKSGALTLTKDHVNVAIHFMTNPDHVRSYSSHTVYAHRRMDYDEELERAEKENAKRAPSFRSKKVTLKHGVKQRVSETNKSGLLTSKEITSFLVHDNTLPLIFKDLKLMDTSTIVNIRQGALPTERMKRKFSSLTNGESIIQADKTMLKTLSALHDNVAEGEEAQSWFAEHRE
jgi:hypothetical protein